MPRNARRRKFFIFSSVKSEANNEVFSLKVVSAGGAKFFNLSMLKRRKFFQHPKADLFQSLSRLHIHTSCEKHHKHIEIDFVREEFMGKLFFYSTTEMHFSDGSRFGVIDQVELKLLLFIFRLVSRDENLCNKLFL